MPRVDLLGKEVELLEHRRIMCDNHKHIIGGIKVFDFVDSLHRLVRVMAETLGNEVKRLRGALVPVYLLESRARTAMWQIRNGGNVGW